MGFHVRLFGRLSVTFDGREVGGLDAGKVQELLCFALLNRPGAHAREALATLLWAESSEAQARKNLRQTLWQIQSALDAAGEARAVRLLRQDAEWISISAGAELWLDVAELEAAAAAARGIAGAELSDEQVHRLRAAVALYRGDLLEGCYQDWCLAERERLQLTYIAMLDKLVAFCVARQAFEEGLSYCARTLHIEPARERTHRQMMRLHYLAGDRTAALRQFDRCAAALERELGVHPARQTVRLHEQIRLDQLDDGGDPSAEPAPGGGLDGHVPLLRRLKELHHMLSGIDRRLLQQIEALEHPVPGTDAGTDARQTVTQTARWSTAP